LFEIVRFLEKNNLKNIAITYPDIAYDYYGKNFILEKIAPKYSECVEEIYKIINFSKEKDINLKIVDFPFCIFKKNNLDEIIKLTDDYDYAQRLKLFYNQEENMHTLSQKKEEKFSFYTNLVNNFKSYFKKETPEMLKNLPRKRNHISKCNKCNFRNICW
jgi:predicted house-cleaning noncanonical NTP pyrophosphatase (MazG superfamily)